MAIGFARLEFVKRASGKNACSKAAYNARARVQFEGSKQSQEQIFDWSYKEAPAHHEIVIPSFVNESYNSKHFLWNAVEKFEARKNSQVAMELLLALPDDKSVSLEDKIELARTFVLEHFVEKGFAAQIDIHVPESNVEEGKEEHNWHAHVLIPTRRFTTDGTFEKNKPRELMTTLRGGKVISGPEWGKLWTHHQNQYFESKGMNLRVDPNGLVAQIHLGPTRMRGRAHSLLEEFWIKQEQNVLESLDPRLILDRVVQTQNIFSKEDVDRFFQKYIPVESIPETSEKFWQQDEIIQLLDSQNQKPLNKFTTKQVHEEEKKILRIADRLVERNAFAISDRDMIEQQLSILTPEQKNAYENVIHGKGLCCIAGLAGTGKSHLLGAIKKTYENEGYIVRGFGPDNATAMLLKDGGFKKSDNIYRFLYQVHHGKIEPTRSKEIWIVDESGKLGSEPLLEFLKFAEKYKAQVIFSGDPLQLPAVERGRMFNTFCKRYGREFLGDIKRQHSQEQREIAKKLATGEIGAAFDAINKNGGFRWSLTKKDSIEDLVKQWAIDKEHFPQSSSAILAYTNAEVAALNEYVRIYRKTRGELGEKEFQCDTICGGRRAQIRISEGDRITFRKNDTELGVKNGETGILVKASANQFVVQFTNKREVIFDPRQHPFFQLGYASTYNRGQGGTFDRVYILHSPFLHKEGFYVGLTRHVRKVYSFVSMEEATSLSDLKRQAMRCSKMETTTDFVTSAELQLKQEQQERQIEIDKMKSSGSIVSKLQGTTLHVFDKLQNKATKLVERFSDGMPDYAFFKSDQKNIPIMGSVVELMNSDKDFASKEAVMQPVLKMEEENATPFAKPDTNRKKAWEALSEPSKNLLKNYFRHSENASSLHTIVKSEAEAAGLNEKDTSHFLKWQEACAKRNEIAHQVSRSISTKELQTVFNKDSLNILQDRAARHEVKINRQNHPKIDLEQGLRDNIDSLLTQLFPEGPNRRDKQGYRFGSKGSLSVACRGAKEGTFYNFETGEGGGLLKLIQETMRLNPDETKSWAHNFLGNPKESPPLYKAQKSATKTEDPWISLKPEKNNPAPDLATISDYFYQTYKEVARHAYKDAKGNLLFYTLRLVDKENPSKKQVIPLSYGYYQGGDEHPRWSLKGFQADKKPLYNLDLLSKHPNAIVLIVEGEKTADAAQRLLAKEGIVVITWSGGSAATSKADWTPITFRNIIIWPDNDSAGFKASDAICTELRRLGVSSLKVIDKEALQKEFPEKWDLADSLPPNNPPNIIKDLLLNALDKAVGIQDLLNNLYPGKKCSEVDVMKAQEILWRVDSRLRTSLEAEFTGKTWEIRNKIIQEASSILLKENETIKEMEKHGLSKDTSKLFALTTMSYRASTGKMPSHDTLNHFREIASNVDISQLFKHKLEIRDALMREFLASKYILTCLDAGTRKQLSEKTQQQFMQEAVAVAHNIEASSVTSIFKREYVREVDD